MNWLGIDIVQGDGVDITYSVGEEFPLEEKKFDLVLASSVFEHDVQFWNTFLEMLRCATNDGLVLLMMPSQGQFHRYPLDCFRFYPDAGIALEKWGRANGFDINLIESFITPVQEDNWADFIAIFSFNPSLYASKLIGQKLNAENWIVDGHLKPETYQEFPFEYRKIKSLENENANLRAQLRENANLRAQLIDYEHVKTELKSVLNSKSWKITKSLRLLKRITLQLKNIS